MKNSFVYKKIITFFLVLLFYQISSQIAFADFPFQINGIGYYSVEFSDPPGAPWVSHYGYNSSAGSWRTDRHVRLMADVDGDGMDDIVGFGDAGVYISYSNGRGFHEPELEIASYGYNAGSWRIDKHVRLMADVDGDGMEDIVGFGDAGVYVSISTGSGFSTPSRWVDWYGYSESAGNWRTDRHVRTMADVNGDGMADIVGYGDYGVYVSYSTGDDFTEKKKKISDFGYVLGSWRVNMHPRILADVNGDGMDDVVGFSSSGVKVSKSTGTGFESPSYWVSGYGYSSGWRKGRHPRYVVDVDGDGKDDIVGFGSNNVAVAISTGSSFETPENWISKYCYNHGYINSDYPRLMGDANGDGKYDIFAFSSSNVMGSRSTGDNFDDEYFIHPNYPGAMYEYKWIEDNYCYNQGWRHSNHPRMIADVNGDGLDDIVGFASAGVVVSLARGEVFHAEPHAGIQSTDLPYSTSFDTGYDKYWDNAVRYYTSSGQRALVTSMYSPHTGSNHIILDNYLTGIVANPATYVTNWFELKCNPYIQPGGPVSPHYNQLKFWWKDFGDANHSQDGIYFSDDWGRNYTKVYSLQPANYSDNQWREFTLNIDALASANELDLGNNFYIKFQQYDYGTMPNGGFAFDDISLSIESTFTDKTKEEQLIAEIPREFNLLQNYPNPFNPNTNIIFEIPEQSDISLKVFDIQGKVVADLYTGRKDAGRFTAQFDGNGLSGGVYFYEIIANPSTGKGQSFRNVKKMMLVK